ncbi:AAA family ATPase [Streptomyces sp. NPDC059373]
MPPRSGQAGGRIRTNIQEESVRVPGRPEGDTACSTHSFGSPNGSHDRIQAAAWPRKWTTQVPGVPVGWLSSGGPSDFAQERSTGVPVKLSERDDEIRLLEQLYEGCAGGKGAGVLTNGPVGCGKTALLQAFGERVIEQGGLFFSVTASVSEQLHPFGVIDQLLNAMRAAGMAAAPCAAEEGGITAPGNGPQAIRRAPVGLLQRICRTICRFSERRPLVIGIDDVHFADEPSLQCLRYLIRRVEPSAVMVVMNESSCYERGLAPLHAETLHLPYCHRIRLAPLTEAGTADQLTQRLGSEPARRVAELCTAASGGNPLLLHALIDDCTAGRPAMDDPHPGDGFRDAYLRCLHRCEPVMLAVARAVAVLGESATPSLAGDLLGVDATSVRRSIADLNAAGLLSAERFRHEAAQLAVLADIPLEDLPAMRSRAAELLHESGAAAVAVAGQLMAAHDSDNASWRVAILREAAREAMAAGDVTESVDYLRHASGICADAAQGARITAALADAQWHIDPAKAARHLHQLSHDVRAGLLTGEDAMVLVRQLLWRGEFAQADDALRIIEANDGRIGEGSQPPAPSPDVTVGRAWLSLTYPGPARLASDGEAGQRLGVPSIRSVPLAALSLLNSAGSRTGDGEEVQGPDQVLYGPSAGTSLTATLFALLFLMRMDRLDEAAHWTEQLLEEPWIRRVPLRRALFETISSAVALGRGAVAAAGEHAGTALNLVAPSAWGVVAGIPLSLAIRAATEQGDFELAMSYLNLPVPPIMFDTPFVLPYLQAVGRYHLVMGHPRAALTNFRSCGELMVKWRLDSPDLADWRNDAAAALIALGRVREARALAKEQLSLLGDRRSRVRGVALRRLAATSDVQDRLTLLQEAVRILDACGDRLELVQAQTDLEAARETLFGRGPSARLWTLPVDEEGVAGGEPGSVPAELTDAQRKVAELAASGCTNAEIAGKLFVTVSTVEQHLTKIYRKLKVRRRSDLRVALTRTGDLSLCSNGR